MTEATKTRGRTLAFAVLWGLVWWAHLRLPSPAAGPEVDASWQQALGVALTTGLRFGHDLWFTHGPVGYFPYGRYEPALFELKLFAWELVFKGVLAAFVTLAALRIQGGVARAAALLVVLFLDGGEDAYAFIAALSIALVCLDGRGRTRVVVTGLGLACLAVLSLTKFTWLMFGVASVCAIAFRFCAGTPRAVRSAAVAVLVFCVSFVLVWLGCGQRLGDLAPYLASSMRISAGYTEAMSIAGPRVEVELALAAALLTLAAAGLRLQRTRALGDATFAMVVAAGLFLTWKSGFTRHLHEANRFFAFAAFAPLLFAARPLPTGARPRSRVELGATTLAALAGVLGFGLALDKDPQSGSVTSPAERLSTLQRYLDPRELETELVIGRTELGERHSLRRIRAEVGDATVDLFGSKQARLFLNDLRWHPRPVFQSYYAYTPELAEANAAFLRGPHAPRFVIVFGGRIDRRYPQSADGAALTELLRLYEPAFWEKGHLLLRRRSKEAPRGEPEIVQRTNARFGEEVELLTPADASSLFLLRLDLERTLFGRVRGACFRMPKLVLHAALNDGTTKRYRLLPGPFELGVLASPLLETDAVWNEWYLGDPPLALRALWVEGEPSASLCYEDTFELELTRLPIDNGARDGVPQLLTLPSFFPQPKRIVSHRPASRRRIGGRPALIVHAPSRLTYELAPGTYRLRGRFGIAGRPEGTGDDELPGEAARFAAALRPAGGGGSIVLERTLELPPGDPSSPTAPLDVLFEIPHEDGLTELVLLTAPAAGRPGTGAYWCDVTVQRANGGPGR